MTLYEMSVLLTAWLVTGGVVYYAIRRGSDWALWALWIPTLVPMMFPILRKGW